MIREAVACDMCGVEKQATNHWFVAYQVDGELHIGGASSRDPQRPGARDLCGEACVHKLVAEYLSSAVRSGLASEKIDATRIRSAAVAAPSGAIVHEEEKRATAATPCRSVGSTAQPSEPRTRIYSCVGRRAL